jgi:transposase
VRGNLTEERAEEAARLVAAGLTLDAVAERLGVHRRTLLRWVERDPAFASATSRPAGSRTKGSTTSCSTRSSARAVRAPRPTPPAGG